MHIFEVDPTEVNIPPDAMETVSIYARPTRKSVFDNQLLLFVKNNPKIEAIKLSCSGCKIIFNIIPKTLDFDRVNLNLTEQKNVTFENETPVSILWRIDNLEILPEGFSLSEEEGLMKAWSKQDICVSYTANEVGAIPKFKLRIVVSSYLFIFISCYTS